MNVNGNNSTTFRLDGKSAVVTGGASGIGRSIAASFAAAGASIHILEVDKKGAEDTAAEIRKEGAEAEWHLCDVSDQKQVKDVFAKIAASTPINILVNNAGVSHVGKLGTTCEEDFDRIFRINVKGVYNCMYAALGYMKASGGGVILNLASIAALAGLSERFAYSMSKGAVLTMTYSVARDYLGDNIRCNCISPARVHTPFVDGFLRKNYPGREQDMMEKLAHLQPIGRMGRPEEVASLALFLCSDAASFITGSNYPIDGGFLNLHG
ncbi:MAG TPA: glucose 1-dehydrogenase [Terriglobales bacterium]|nr:glucose 1-dehydrogenase [Terriglobales bacterium]